MSMPTSWAPSRSSAAARIALPTSVCLRSSHRPTASATEPPKAISRGTFTTASPSKKPRPM